MSNLIEDIQTSLLLSEAGAPDPSSFVSSPAEQARQLQEHFYEAIFSQKPGTNKITHVPVPRPIQIGYFMPEHEPTRLELLSLMEDLFENPKSGYESYDVDRPEHQLVDASELVIAVSPQSGNIVAETQQLGPEGELIARSYWVYQPGQVLPY